MHGYSTLCYDDHIQNPPLRKTFVFSIHVESKYFRSNKYNLYKLQLHWKQWRLCYIWNIYHIKKSWQRNNIFAFFRSIQHFKLFQFYLTEYERYLIFPKHLDLHFIYSVYWRYNFFLCKTVFKTFQC